MINYNSEQYKKWIALLETNPKKATGYLLSADKTEGCCLGWACIANGLEATSNGRFECSFFGQEKAVLVDSLAEPLNLETTGAFTFEGVQFVSIWLRENNFVLNGKSRGRVYSLTNLNDYTSLDHEQIATFIKKMAEWEQELGVSLFKPFCVSSPL